MKQIDLRAGFLGLLAVAIASSGGLLVACSSSSQTQAPDTTVSAAPSPAASDTNSMQGMDHGKMSGMNHGMAMDLGPADANYDLRFIDAMTPHHGGAVVMAKEALQKSKRPEIKKLATDIISAQNKEISELKEWRTAWYPKASATSMADDQMKDMAMSMDLGAADSEFDLRFINAMIPHHQGAVVMAQDALNKSKRPEIQKLAKDIIASQKAEIAQMEQWRKAWYNK